MKYIRSLLFIACSSALVATAADETEVSLSKDLMPLFQRSCMACHQREGGDKGAVDSTFLFEKKEDVLKGIGKIVVPEKPERSYLLKLITPPEDPKKKKRMMPPTGSKPPAMSKEEIQKITAWIQAGAKDN